MLNYHSKVYPSTGSRGVPYISAYTCVNLAPYKTTIAEFKGEKADPEVGSDRPIAAYRPGSVVCLEGDSDGHWQIDWMIRPELLRQG